MQSPPGASRPSDPTQTHAPQPRAGELTDDAQAGLILPAETGETQSACVTPPAPGSMHLDLLHGKVRPTVFWLALPVFGEQILNCGVAWNDQLLAGHIDNAATVAAGFGSYVEWLVSMLFMLVGIGATAVIARAVGAGRHDEANEITGQSLTMAFGLGLVATMFVFAFGGMLVKWFQISVNSADLMIQFMRIEAIAYVIEAVTFVGTACLRGAGDTRTPMVVLIVVNIVNIAASRLLAFTFDMGSAGIAWGTVAGRVIGGALTIIVLFGGWSALRVRVASLRPHMAKIWRVARIGIPASADGLFMWIGHFIFMRFVTQAGGGYDGDTLLAAHMVGIRIEALSYLPSTAWATAAATLVGQNLGVGNVARARACTESARMQTTLLLACVGTFFFFQAEWLFAQFTNDPRVVECGAPALRNLSMMQPILAALAVYSHALRGAGDTMYPMIITLVCVMALRVPVAYVLGVIMSLGLVGVWCGMYADLFARAVLMTYRYRRGRWDTTTV